MPKAEINTDQTVYAPHDTEIQLWRDYRQGSSMAFEQLVRHFYRDLHFYGSRFTRDSDLLKDCLQDLFLDLWAYRSKVVQTDYVRPYLYKSLRRKIYQQALPGTTEVSRELLPFEEHNDNDLTAEQLLIQTELSEYRAGRLNTLLQRLSARQREAIYLKFYAELNNEAIADILQVNKQSVANLIHRGLSRLREEWPSLLPMLMIGLKNLF